MNGLISQQDYIATGLIAAFGLGMCLLIALIRWRFLGKRIDPPERRALQIPWWLTVSCSLLWAGTPFFSEFGVERESPDLSMAISGSVANLVTIWIISLAVWKYGWSRLTLFWVFLGITLLMLPMLLIDTFTAAKIGVNAQVHIVLTPMFFLAAVFVVQQFLNGQFFLSYQPFSLRRSAFQEEREP